MTDHPGKSPDEQELAKRVQDLPDVASDDAFREDLRSRFVHGGLESPAAETGTYDPEAGRRWWQWAVPVVGVAAAAIAAIILLNGGPAMHVLDVADGSAVRIDGAPAILHTGQVLRAGAEIEVPEGERVDLVARGVVLYEVTGGTRMTLPATPGRWFNRTVVCSVFVGELRLKTGVRFAGSELRVYTPDGIVEVTGTLLSIQCDAEGTCVCVLEGTARVGVNDDDLEPVTPGNRKIMLRDGTVKIIPVKPMHRDGVLEFNERVGNRLGDR
ncbi:MAG: hypothetical protein V3V49_14935 [Candidatus Krumholzibacteria bacterium]